MHPRLRVIALAGGLGLIGIAVIAVLMTRGSSTATQARAYVRSHGADALRVSASLAAVDTFVQSYDAAQPPGGLQGLAILAERSRDTLSLLRADPSHRVGGELGVAEAGMFRAAGTLRTAMTTLAALSPFPREGVTRFDAELALGEKEWNSDARTIWRLAGDRSPPLIRTG